MIASQGGVTMPGKGKIILRPYTPEERAAYRVFSHGPTWSCLFSQAVTRSRVSAAKTEPDMFCMNRYLKLVEKEPFS